MLYYGQSVDFEYLSDLLSMSDTYDWIFAASIFVLTTFCFLFFRHASVLKLSNVANTRETVMPAPNQGDSDEEYRV